MKIAKLLRVLCRASKEYLADNIISCETEYRHALARADKCRSRGDDRGTGVWFKAAQRHLLDSMRETASAGIVGNHVYAEKMTKLNLIRRMN